MSVKLQKTGPGVVGLKELLKRIKQSDVLVGIPAEKTQRRRSPITNASLLFIHTHGSPLKHIPARPVVEPAIAANRETIAPHLAAAAKLTLEQKPAMALRELKLAGTVASNATKRWFTDPRNGWAPNAPSTIARKGSDKPLIDSGFLRKSITWVVRKNGSTLDNL